MTQRHDRTAPAPRAVPGRARPAPHGVLGVGRRRRRERSRPRLRARRCRARAATSTPWRGRCRTAGASSAPTSSAAANPIGSPTRRPTRCPTYVADMVTLLARLDARDGALARHVDGRPDRHGARRPARVRRSRRLVLNDVGPTIDADGVARIGELPRPAAHLGERGRGRRLPADDLARLRPAHAATQWLALTRPMLRRDGDRFAPALRPGDRRRAARDHAGRRRGRRGGALGRLRRDPLPDAACCAAPTPTCSRATTAEAMSERGPQAQRARVRRRRPCADARRRRPGRGRAGVPAEP